jgi:hypothetical protein
MTLELPGLVDRWAETSVSKAIVSSRPSRSLDSTLLGLLIAANRRHRGHGGELRILVGPQTPMSACEVTGFDRLLSIRGADAVREGGSGSGLSTPAQGSVRNAGRRRGPHATKRVRVT